jgi:hypothetical protein
MRQMLSTSGSDYGNGVAASASAPVGAPFAMSTLGVAVRVKNGTSLARRRMIKRAVDESTRAVVSPDGLKLCLHDRDLNELYNFRDDPLERQNLYSDRQYASVISRLAGEIHRWQESTDDKPESKKRDRSSRWGGPVSGF